MASVTADVQGIPDMLRALREIDPELRKEAAREIRNVAKPIAVAAKARIPDTPLSGWVHNGRTGWSAGMVRRGVSTRVKFSAKRTQDTIPLVTLRQKTPAGEIFDMAGRRSSGSRPQGQAMIRNLNARHGRASRGMWPTVEAFQPQIIAGLRDAVRNMERTINERTER